MSKIFEGHETPVVRQAGGYKEFIRREVRKKWGLDANLINWDKAGEPVKAYISRGWWGATCPDCGLPMPASSVDGFYCIRCQNLKNAGHVRPVEFPENRAEIEAVLLKRINPKKRNWMVGETVENLLAENAAHPEEVVD